MEEKIIKFDEYDNLDKYDFGFIRVAYGNYDKKKYPNVIEALKEYTNIHYGDMNSNNEVELNRLFFLLKDIVVKMGKFDGEYSLSKFFYEYREVRDKEKLSHTEIMINTCINYITYASPIRDDKRKLKYGLTDEILNIDPWEEY